MLKNMEKRTHCTVGSSFKAHHWGFESPKAASKCFGKLCCFETSIETLKSWPEYAWIMFKMTSHNAAPLHFERFHWVPSYCHPLVLLRSVWLMRFLAGGQETLDFTYDYPSKAAEPVIAKSLISARCLKCSSRNLVSGMCWCLWSFISSVI